MSKQMNKYLSSLALATILTIAGFGSEAAMSQTKAQTKATLAKRPNILLIVADDLGYADMGAFGGNINTPNLDKLASTGQRFLNFYTSPTCSPSRSMLLTGTDNHLAGLGNMAEWLGPKQKGKPGYEGHLNNNVISISSILSDAGYHTYMAGKWHLGEKPSMWPAARGFERDLSILGGAGSHWPDMQGFDPAHPKLEYTRNGKQITQLPKEYFSSKNFTDFIINSIDENENDDKPFFAYLAYQAPHGPLALPDDWLEKYKSKFDAGYDVLRKTTLVRQKQLGLLPQDAVGFPRLPFIPAWDALSDKQKQNFARKMELYAGMVENMDHHIGRLLKHLEAKGELDNTLVIFLSDNGAAGEDISELIAKLSPQMKDWFTRTFDNGFDNWGKPGSAIDYGPAWAQTSMVPFRQFKGVLAEGGIRAPMIISGPGVGNSGELSTQLLHVMDIVPTILEMVGAKHPSDENPKDIAAVQGKSMVPLLFGEAKSVRGENDWLGWELFGNRAIRQGEWKILYQLKTAGGTGDWQLFNLDKDPAELHDLSQKFPGKRQEMLKLWEEYVSTNGIIISNAGPFGKGLN